MSWAYVVLDVETRAVLNIHVVRSLSASSAVNALRGGVEELKKLGIEESLVVMSDGGSDFTSHEFKAACDEVSCRPLCGLRVDGFKLMPLALLYEMGCPGHMSCWT